MPDFSGNVIVLALRPPRIDAMIHISDHTIKNAILSYSKPYLLWSQAKLSIRSKHLLETLYKMERFLFTKVKEAL